MLVFGSTLSVGLVIALSTTFRRAEFRATREGHAMRMWLVALIIQASFWLLFLFRDQFGHPLISITFVNTLSVWAMIEYVRAIREFLTRADRPVLFYGTLLAVLLAGIWYGTIAPNYAARVILVSVPAVFLMLWLAWTLIRHAEVALQRPARISAVFFIIAAMGFAVRGVDILLNPGMSFDASSPQQVSLLIYALLPVFGSLGFLRMQAERANARLLARARTDDLTGALNRRAFAHLARHTLAGCKRTRRPVSMMLLDLDRFKQINDTFGHAAGDEALKTFHARLCELLRAEDIVARVGGEEFAVLLPGAALDDAGQVAERVRTSIADTPVAFERRKIELRVSIGVALWDEESPSIDSMLAAADKAMYAAKRRGRNRVRLAPAL